VQSLQETSNIIRGILSSQNYVTRKNKHHPIISAIKSNHGVCLEWYISNGYNIFNDNLLQFVIDEIICKEKCYIIKITTVAKIINLMENGWKYRNNPQENFVKFLVRLHQNDDLFLIPDASNIYRYINLRTLQSEILIAAYNVYLHARQNKNSNAVHMYNI
jgi:hypothetical protein